MNEEYNSLDTKISAKFQKYLEHGEYIVYCGKSSFASDGKISAYSKGYNLFFAIFWTGFSLFWTFSAWTMGGGEMAFLGIPFILIGVYLLVNVFKGGNIPFAVTNMRILKITGNGLEMEYLKNITHVQTNPNRGNVDVFYSVEYQDGLGKIDGCGTIGGLSPEEAERVCYIIDDESAKAHIIHNMYT